MKKRYICFWSLLLFILCAIPTQAGSMSTVSGTAQIQPMEDGSGKYMLKSEGFYCLDGNGAISNKEEIHYFDHYEIDGTIWNGYYYHEKDGLFLAGNPRFVQIKNLSVKKTEISVSEETGESLEIVEDVVFNGLFRVGNLGKMSGAPTVCYLENLQMAGTTYNGYYYLNENGRLIRDAGIYALKMSCNGRMFDGHYYFGGAGGALVTESCYTPEGYLVDENGRIEEPEEPGISALSERLETMMADYKGQWSVYVKDLGTGEELLTSDISMGSASVIKLFVMAATYKNMKQVLETEGTLMKLPADDPKVLEKVNKLLWNMITVSDNESYNELVRLQTSKHDFKHGARYINVFLEQEGYEVTRVRHTLQPSASKSEGIGEFNITSAKECGQMLEKIYRKECVSEEASEKMLELLLNQTVNWKIRSGLPAGVRCANKSGENSSNQHDVSIIFGENTDYILCIMSEDYGDENQTFRQMGAISRMAYTYLNMWADDENT